jgi:hypothetical protein
MSLVEIIVSGMLACLSDFIDVVIWQSAIGSLFLSSTAGWCENFTQLESSRRFQFENVGEKGRPGKVSGGKPAARFSPHERLTHIQCQLH